MERSLKFFKRIFKRRKKGNVVSIDVSEAEIHRSESHLSIGSDQDTPISSDVSEAEILTSVLSLSIVSDLSLERTRSPHSIEPEILWSISNLSTLSDLSLERTRSHHSIEPEILRNATILSDHSLESTRSQLSIVSDVSSETTGKDDVISNDAPEGEIPSSESHPSIVCDLSSESFLRDLFKKIIQWRTWKSLRDVEFHWSDLHLEIFRDYFFVVFKVCDFRELPSAKLFNDTLRGAAHPSPTTRSEIAASFTQELQHFFVVPELRSFYQSENSIKKYQLVETFISFLVQLLYHKTDLISGPCKDQIGNLEKGLRFLLTILGDVSVMQWEEHEEFQILMAEFEAVANQAGSLVHSLFFSIDPGIEKMDESIGVVLNNIDLLTSNIVKFLDSLSSFSRSALITPETSVVDSLLIVDSLIHYLEDLMNPEDNLNIAYVKDQIKILHQGLTCLQSSIKDLGSPRCSEIGELKEPLMQIGDMAHQAEYLILAFLVGDAPFWYLINRLTDINHKIERIRTELQEITKEYKSGGLKVAKYLNAPLSFPAKRNAEADDVIVGFDDNTDDLLNHLVGGTKRLQVISIFGMPGLGKTTLAKKLYNHPSVNYHFYKLSWCVVSEMYQKQSVLSNILIDIKSEFDKERILTMDEDSLSEHIYKTLKGRRYLIVMDDVWDPNAWGDWLRYFPEDGNGSRILFTSRNKDVAPPNCIIYALPSLSKDQCWELLKKKVFRNEPCPLELIGIGEKIAEKCGGLPLAVVVIAGILSTMDTEKTTWEEVGGNLASHIFHGGDNSVMQILELSYKHLPDYLKPCFLYFGTFFQMDKEVPARKLMRLWIAEGFAHKEGAKSAENVAEEYLMELIDKSLVMVAKRRSDGGVRTCVIHNLLRDLCLRRSEEENFLKFVKNNFYSIYEKGRRLQAPDYCIVPSYCQNARSFHGHDRSNPFYVGNMRLLRVFHFDYNALRFAKFMGIEFVINLRYLVISYLPASIGSLVNLEYLRVEASEIVYLPSAVLNMTKLRYFHVGSEARYDKDCNRSQTNNLEFLSRVVVCDAKDEEMLKCSPHLRKLKCKFDPLSSNWEIPSHDLGFFTKLESLNLEFGRYGIDVTNFPTNIRKLTLSRCNLREMSTIGKLKSLEILKLGGHFFMGQRWDTRDGEFQKLRFLKLEETNLTQWNVDSSQHFPNLQQLILLHCYLLEEIPCEIGEIATLQLIEVKGLCPQSMVESARTIQQQQQDMGNEELRVIISTDM